MKVQVRIHRILLKLVILTEQRETRIEHYFYSLHCIAHFIIITILII